MSKEFEKQYRDYITEQVPDMWDRIDAGLKEKKQVQRCLERERNTGRKEAGNAGRERFGFGRKQAAAVLVPAAAVFLCFLVSKILMENHRKSDNMTADYHMAFEENGFAQNVYSADDSDYGGMAGGADTAGGAGITEMPENEAGADIWEGEAVGAAEEIGADAGEDGDAGMSGSEGKVSDANTSVPDDTGKDSNAEKENSAVIGKDTAETAGLFRARVKIVKTGEAAGSGYDAMYLAQIEEIVEKAEDSALEEVEEGTEIYFYTGVDTDRAESVMLEIGETYEVILEPVSGGEKYFAKKIDFIP